MSVGKEGKRIRYRQEELRIGDAASLWKLADGLRRGNDLSCVVFGDS